MNDAKAERDQKRREQAAEVVAEIRQNPSLLTFARAVHIAEAPKAGDSGWTGERQQADALLDGQTKREGVLIEQQYPTKGGQTKRDVGQFGSTPSDSSDHPQNPPHQLSAPHHRPRAPYHVYPHFTNPLDIQARGTLPYHDPLTPITYHQRPRPPPPHRDQYGSYYPSARGPKVRNPALLWPYSNPNPYLHTLDTRVPTHRNPYSPMYTPPPGYQPTISRGPYNTTVPPPHDVLYHGTARVLHRYRNPPPPPPRYHDVTRSYPTPHIIPKSASSPQQDHLNQVQKQDTQSPSDSVSSVLKAEDFDPDLPPLEDLTAAERQRAHKRIKLKHVAYRAQLQVQAGVLKQHRKVPKVVMRKLTRGARYRLYVRLGTSRQSDQKHLYFQLGGYGGAGSKGEGGQNGDEAEEGGGKKGSASTSGNRGQTDGADSGDGGSACGAVGGVDDGNQSGGGEGGDDSDGGANVATAVTGEAGSCADTDVDNGAATPGGSGIGTRTNTGTGTGVGTGGGYAIGIGCSGCSGMDARDGSGGGGSGSGVGTNVAGSSRTSGGGGTDIDNRPISQLQSTITEGTPQAQAEYTMQKQESEEEVDLSLVSVGMNLDPQHAYSSPSLVRCPLSMNLVPIVVSEPEGGDNDDGDGEVTGPMRLQ